MRPTDPHAQRGPRTHLAVSRSAWQTVFRVATRFGLTRRQLADALLEDEALVVRKAAQVASESGHAEPAESH